MSLRKRLKNLISAYCFTLAAVVSLYSFVALADSENICRRGSCFPLQSVTGPAPLPLRAVARFSYYFFKVYDGALYYPSGSVELSLGQQPLKLELVYLRDISREDLIQPSIDYLKSHVPEKFDSLAERLATINKAYQSVKEGDRYALEFFPGRGITLYFNGEKKVNIEGDDFAEAYLGIWLSKNTAAGSFRKTLLKQLKEGSL